VTEPSRVPAVVGDAIHAAWDFVVRAGAIKPGHRRARRFAAFGADSVICFPYVALFGERYIRIGVGSVLGPYSSLSAGVGPGQELDIDTVVSIGDRCVIGRGSSIVAHQRVEIGNDVWTGPGVYISDANHGYEDRSVPPGRQFAATRSVCVGDGAWLGTGVLVMPGATIGRHVVVGGGSVVTGALPDYSVAVGNPARVVRRYVDGDGWVPVDDD
jgi:acetyltransferase-like isoleucine patch superfamily enzyme